MILPVTALVVGVACFFTALAVWRRGVLDYVVAAALWLVAAIGGTLVEIPYQVENVADNTVGTAVTGVQKFASAEAAISWVFLLLAVVMMLNVIYLSFQKRRPQI